MDLVTNVIRPDIERITLIKSSVCPTTTKNKRLFKTVSMEKIPCNYSGNIVQNKTKRASKFLKLKLFYKSESNLVISSPIPDCEFNDLVSCHKDPDRLSFYEKYQRSKPRGLYRLDRKKSLSTGNLFALTSEECHVPHLHNSLASPLDLPQGVLPDVPPRTCSFLENCTTDDKYLVQQGLRLQGDLVAPSQRWSDPTHDKVRDVEPVYDTPLAMRSSKTSDYKTSSMKAPSSQYANYNISTEEDRVFFSGSHVHTYVTPRPTTNIVESEKGSKDAATSPRSVEVFDEDYVNMFGNASDTCKPRPAWPPTEHGKPHSTICPLPRDHPWSSHFTDAPPALPPRPPSLVTDKLSVEERDIVKPPPPPLLVPCNSFDDSVTNVARLSISTSSPCLCPGRQQYEGDSDDHLYDSPPTTPYADDPNRRLSKLPSSPSNPCLFNEDISSLNKLLRDLNELTLTH